MNQEENTVEQVIIQEEEDASIPETEVPVTSNEIISSISASDAEELVNIAFEGRPALLKRKLTFADRASKNLRIIRLFESLEDKFCLPIGYYGNLTTLRTVYSSIKRRKVIIKILETQEHILDDSHNDILFFDNDKPRLMLDKLALLYDLLYLELDGTFIDLAENTNYDFSVFKTSSLRHLIIKNNNNITTMEGIQHIPNLQYIELVNCENLVHVYKFININIICRVNNCNKVIDDKETFKTEDKLIIYS